MLPNKKDLLHVGWREYLSLPEMGIPLIKAKVDTGARTSALHTQSYELFTKNDEQWVRLVIQPRMRSKKLVTYEAKVVEFKKVRDSGGHEEIRPFIESTALIGSTTWRIRITLTNREKMNFRMLLGRTALAKRFVVDSGSDYLQGRPNPSAL